MIVHESALQHYKANEFATHVPAPPRFDTAFKVDFATLESRQISSEEVLTEEPWKTLAEGGEDSPTVRLRAMKRELRLREKQIQKLQQVGSAAK
jgi:hypothetical protein